MIVSEALLAEAEALLAACRQRGATIATAESCTGGLIAGVLTAVAGASDVVDRGYVTYSNAAKTAMLGVPAALIAAHGAVSAEVAAAMAQGARERSGATIAIAVTGVAGPGGGSADKPVGLVWFGLAHGADAATESVVFAGDRTAVRVATVAHAFAMMAAILPGLATP
jgi:nicotinamide-nucleotide amidase